MPNTTSGVDRADKATAIANLHNELARFDDLCEQLASLGLGREEISRLPISADLVSVILAKKQAADTDNKAGSPMVAPCDPQPAAESDEIATVSHRFDMDDLDEIALWFDLLRDMAIMLGEELPFGRAADLSWSIQKLAAKFGDDTRRFVSTPLAQTKGGAA